MHCGLSDDVFFDVLSRTVSVLRCGGGWRRYGRNFPRNGRSCSVAAAVVVVVVAIAAAVVAAGSPSLTLSLTLTAGCPKTGSLFCLLAFSHFFSLVTRTLLLAPLYSRNRPKPKCFSSSSSAGTTRAQKRRRAVCWSTLIGRCRSSVDRSVHVAIDRVVGRREYRSIARWIAPHAVLTRAAPAVKVTPAAAAVYVDRPLLWQWSGGGGVWTSWCVATRGSDCVRRRIVLCFLVVFSSR